MYSPFYQVMLLLTFSYPVKFSCQWSNSEIYYIRNCKVIVLLTSSVIYMYTWGFIIFSHFFQHDHIDFSQVQSVAEGTIANIQDTYMYLSFEVGKEYFDRDYGKC